MDKEQAIHILRWSLPSTYSETAIRKIADTYLEENKEILEEYHQSKVKNNVVLDSVSEPSICFNCNGWGYTLLPNGRRDKGCTVCDGSNVR